MKKEFTSYVANKMAAYDHVRSTKRAFEDYGKVVDVRCENVVTRFGEMIKLTVVVEFEDED